MYIGEETSVTSKVPAACGEGGKDSDFISSAVLEVFSAKKTSIFSINPRLRLFLRSGLLFEYLKHEKHVSDFGQVQNCTSQCEKAHRRSWQQTDWRRHSTHQA